MTEENKKVEYHAYCNICKLPFLTLEDLIKHNQEAINKHRKLMTEK